VNRGRRVPEPTVRIQSLSKFAACSGELHGREEAQHPCDLG